jgi:hypothetical protein
MAVYTAVPERTIHDVLGHESRRVQMPYNEPLAERVRAILAQDGIEAREQKMFGGLSFMVGEAYACG